jgi:fumarate hydratase class I
MKGGGSENMSAQFSLPDVSLGAARDLDGVRRAVLSAVQRAQGYGCAPGILGVAIGGDRAGGYEEAKHQLLRDLSDVNPDPRLARLERRILKDANSLGIGPMGLGGKTTLLAVKIGSRPRLPASYFVTVAYLCWAARRGVLVVSA